MHVNGGVYFLTHGVIEQSVASTYSTNKYDSSLILV